MSHKTQITISSALTSDDAQMNILWEALADYRAKTEKAFDKVKTARATYKYEYKLNALSEVERALRNAENI